jgi:LmbE family N-acetylglucosaminyl deacetylase
MASQELNRVAMVIAAHADDAEFMAAGTVATWIKDEWEVYYIICTNGGGGGPDDAQDVSMEARQQIIDIRKREQEKAAAILGVKKVIFLGYPDSQLEPRVLRRDLVREMRRYRPSRVICQSPERVWQPALALGAHHIDHRIVGEATLDAIYPACQNPWDFPELFTEEKLHPHKVSEIYIVGTPFANHVVDVSETIDAKIQALRSHESQLGDRIDRIGEYVKQRAERIGQRHQIQYAEEFHLTYNP